MDTAVPKTLQFLERFQEKNPARFVVVDRYRRHFFDSFMDVLGAYIDWREAKKKPRDFLDRQLAAWGLSQWIPEYPARVVERMLAQGTQMLWINDDATISAALSQLVVDGKTLPSVRARASVCINRQLMNSVVHKRGYADSQDSIACLADVKRCMEEKS